MVLSVFSDATSTAFTVESLAKVNLAANGVV
jgi:hypothetical protein